MEQIDQAVKILKANGVVGLPTETVYGLASSIKSTTGIDQIFHIKERPFFDPLIVHVADLEQAKSCARIWPDQFDLLAKTFWPGPLTLIVPKNKYISGKISSGLDTVGIRMPKHELALEVIRKLGDPVAAPSANKFTKTSPTCAKHVKESFPNLLVLDGGPCDIGIESTIIGLEDNIPVIYRPGMITQKDIQKCLKEEVKEKASPVAPGHMKHHYMPETPLIAKLKELELKPNQFPAQLLERPIYWTLDESPVLAARTFYQKLRDFDHEEKSCVFLEFSREQLKESQFQGLFNRISKAASYFIID